MWHLLVSQSRTEERWSTSVFVQAVKTKTPQTGRLEHRFWTMISGASKSKMRVWWGAKFVSCRWQPPSLSPHSARSEHKLNSGTPPSQPTYFPKGPLPFAVNFNLRMWGRHKHSICNNTQLCCCCSAAKSYNSHPDCVRVWLDYYIT